MSCVWIYHLCIQLIHLCQWSFISSFESQGMAFWLRLILYRFSVYIISWTHSYKNEYFSLEWFSLKFWNIDKEQWTFFPFAFAFHPYGHMFVEHWVRSTVGNMIWVSTQENLVLRIAMPFYFKKGHFYFFVIIKHDL